MVQLLDVDMTNFAVSIATSPLPRFVSPAGVRADPTGGPGPEGDPPSGPGRRRFLGEYAAGRDLHPPEEAGPRSALGGLAQTGPPWLRLRPLMDRKREAADLKEREELQAFLLRGNGETKKGRSFQSKSLVAALWVSCHAR